MLKASWGGGGRGMRPVMGEGELADKVLEGKREAEAAFGNGEGYHAVECHNPHYDFNDAILPIGARYWVTLVEGIFGAA